ncbi:MAG: lipoprotein signal peptidase, partial [Flavobacteriales bacterium]|nr:lipoprotein signal peptidase [Flavobacteriales bacterium]
MKSLKAPIALVFLLILVDQTIKIWIKTTFALGESLEIFPWFQLHLVENPGMAYGLQWGGITGKYFLSIFRLLAILGISYYLWDIW